MPPSTTFDYNDKLSFLGEWFDFEAAFEKKFLITFFPYDGTIELFDIDQNRLFLKRSRCEGVTYKDLIVGGIIRVYGRQIKLIDYANCKTKNLIGKQHEHIFVMIKPSAMGKLGEILRIIESEQFQIINLIMLRLSRDEANRFFETRQGDAFLPFITEHVSSGSIVALDLVGFDAFNRWQQLLGPFDPQEARQKAPQSLRAIYGIERQSNAFHMSDTPQDIERELAFFFSDNKTKTTPRPGLQLTNSTCGIIKPHAINEGKLGYIIGDIENSKFRINTMQMFYLNSVDADEFLEIYKDVIGDYQAMKLSFLDGPCIVMEIIARCDGLSDVHGEFRKFCGPADTDIARQIRPDTLRAKYGVDKYRNAIHCTDLPGDTVLDLQYFFKTLS